MSIEAAWNILQEHSLESAILLAVLCVISATTGVKILAEHWYRRVTRSARAWRAFSILVSGTVGLVAGVVVAIAQEAWWTIPTLTVLPGLGWRLVKACLPRRVADAMMTSTDRQYDARSQGS